MPLSIFGFGFFIPLVCILYTHKKYYRCSFELRVSHLYSQRSCMSRVKNRTAQHSKMVSAGINRKEIVSVKLQHDYWLETIVLNIRKGNLIAINLTTLSVCARGACVFACGLFVNFITPRTQISIACVS